MTRRLIVGEEQEEDTTSFAFGDLVGEGGAVIAAVIELFAFEGSIHTSFTRSAAAASVSYSPRCWLFILASNPLVVAATPKCVPSAVINSAAVP